MKWLLDTNIVSEARKRKSNAQVVAWLASQPSETLYISVITIGEIRFGIESLRLHDRFQAESLERWLMVLQERFQGRIKSVNSEIANIWGGLSPTQPLPTDDGLIAATAIYHGMTVVTRNAKDFERSGVPIYNPFND